jgi:HlyD family secretion protein
VARIELQSDAVTEERIVNITFDRVPTQLYLGELAEVTLRLPGARNVLTVPRAALAQHGGTTGVWQVKQGRARFKPVQPGVQTADRVQVLAGLAEGDSLIVYSGKQLEDGMRVRDQRLTQR